jgi:hypothetical protein
VSRSIKFLSFRVKLTADILTGTRLPTLRALSINFASKAPATSLPKPNYGLTPASKTYKPARSKQYNDLYFQNNMA